MSEAPGRIWAQDADPNECDFIGGGWWDDEIGSVQYPDIVEYTRTDLVQSQIDAAVAAEREACARLVESMFAPGSEEEVTCDVAAAAIRARGSTDT